MNEGIKVLLKIYCLKALKRPHISGAGAVRDLVRSLSDLQDENRYGVCR